jgi:hypothetical protein
MKPRKVIVQIEMLTGWRVRDLKKYLKAVFEGSATDIEVRCNVIRDTKPRRKKK